MTEKFKNIVINFIKENWEDTNILYNIEKYTQDSNSLDDIGADSLDYANFVMELEKEYDRYFDDDQFVVREKGFFVRTKTYGEICEYCEIINKTNK